MKVRKIEPSDVVMISPKGRLSGGIETTELKDEIYKALESGNTRLIIDLGDTLYLNSTSLGLLISAHKDYQEKGGGMKLCRVNKNIDNILVITKLSMVFDVYDTSEQAIASFIK
jgi:anti-sigma B factor antagonist